MRLSIKRTIERSNYLNTYQILADLRAEEMREMGRSASGTGLLVRANVTCVGFLGTDPNIQIAYAKEAGFFPEDV